MDQIKNTVNQWYRQAKTWIEKRKPFSYAVIGVGVIVLGGIIWIAFTLGSPNSNDRSAFNSQGETQEPVDTRVPSPLTGKKIAKAQAEQPVIGIMISNSSDARPQSGLNEAGIVFEAIAEGGITRYLALFQDINTDFVGPVRSLRPYFIDFARAFDASVAHVGGSQEALNNARSELRGRDIDQFSVGTRAFERVGFRFAPHNVYTNLDDLLAIANQNGHTTNDFESLLRQEQEPPATPDATTINVNFSSANYNSQWKYNQESNNYSRFVGGTADKDRETDKTLRFDSVVVLKARYGSFFRDGTTYSTVDSTGDGTAYIFQNGEAERVTWKRASVTDQFEFSDSDGEPFALRPGRTWFAMQPTNQAVTFE